jgi:hypothetical protein
MSDPTYNNQVISEYLLGSLSEAESERLDELSITDGEFAVALSAAEKELIDSYVQRELSGDELNRFEAHYRASAFRRDKVDFAKALQVFGGVELGEFAEATHSKDRFSVEKKRGWFSVFNHFSAPRPPLQWGFAIAAIVLLITGGLLLFQNLRLRQQMSQTQARRDEFQQREQKLQKQIEEQRTTNATTEQELAQVRKERAHLEEELRRSGKPQPSPGGSAIASFIFTPQLRGAGQFKTITIPAGTEQVAMQLQLEPNQYANYTVALSDQLSHQVLWRSGRVRARGVTDSKSLSVSFPANLLKAQTYSLQVSGISSAGNSEFMSDYPFKVVK